MLYACFALKAPDIDQPLGALSVRLGDILARKAPSPGASYALVRSDGDTEGYAWRNADESGQVWLNEEEPEGKFITVGGADNATLDVLKEAVAAGFSFMSVSELTEQARGSFGERPHLLTRLAAAATGPYDPAVAEVIRRALGDPTPSVRKAAGIGAGTLLWRELIPDLQNAEDREFEADVRDVLEEVLDQLHGVRS